MTTSISWTNETWNPLVGCSKLSVGCQKCYAAEAAKSARLQQFPQYQKVKDWDGTIEFVENQLLKPLSWRSPKKVFVCSMSDTFHANVKDEWLDQIFAIMAIACQHTFQILTKRPERMQQYLSDPVTVDRIKKAGYEFTHNMDCLNNWPLPNVWLGTSVENQKAADDRIPSLLKTPAVLHFLSCEPLLEQVNLSDFLSHTMRQWVIIGGESGPGARPCHIDWIRSLVQQCQQTKTAAFVKQLGSQAIDSSPYIDGVVQNHFQVKLKSRKGGDISEFPLDLQVREFPRW